ncbi:MAG: PAS domain S-box protein [Verrucomicrobia bacterium]|nr:PAS domain S-box protein [Verrucomicrobiota bacterium]
MGDARSVDDVLITSELARRPAREPDYNAESRALSELAQELARNPRGVLQRLAHLVIELCHADSAGVSVLESGGERAIFRWHAAAGAFAPSLQGTIPREASPCGTVIERDRVLLFRDAERFFPALREVQPRIYESLLVPWEVGGRVVGTLWAISHTPEHRFDAEDARLLKNLARFASAAHAVASRGEKADGLQAERIAALNLMEDAIAARKEAERANAALRRSEARLAADLHGMRRLYDLHTRIATETDLKTALDEILATACEFTNTDLGCIQLVSEDGKRLDMFTWRGHADDSPFIHHFRHEGFAQGWDTARVERRRFIIEETVGFPGLDGTEAGEAMLADGISAVQSALMVSRKGETVGVLSTQFRQPHSPGEEELKLVDLLAWTAADFVERHRANTTLRESEVKYRTLFDWMDEGYCIIQMIYDEAGQAVDWRFVQVNRAFELNYGLHAAEGKTIRELAPGIEPKWLEIYTRVAETGEPLRFEGDSTALQRIFSLYAFRIGDPHERKVAVIFRDITTRGRAEEALRASEERMRTLADAVPQIIWANDAEGRATYFNRRWYEYTGLPPEESAGPGWQAVVHPDDAPASVEQWKRALAAGETFDCEYRLRGADGAYRWFIGRNVPMHESTGRVAGWFGTATDIQDLKEAEAALGESQEHLRLVVENARDYAIFSMDLQRRITSWNRGGETILGYHEKEILGQSGDIIYTAEDRANDAPGHEMRTALAAGRVKDERWHVRKDGSRFWGSGVMTVMRDARGEALGFVKIFRDDTAALEAREALEKSHQELSAALRDAENARAEAEAADRAKDHFLAVLSHELRTPLTPVQMAIYALEREKRLTVRGRDLLALIRENIKVETQLIDDLLDVGRIVHGKLDLKTMPLDLHACVRQALEICHEDLTGKSLEVVVALDAADHHVAGDSTRLQQIFWNLVKNAVKFTPASGRVTVRSHNSSPGRIAVEIIDTGIGIEAWALERIFNAFEQGTADSARHYGGLGLGLAISRAVAEAHGGRLAAASAGPGQGATFTVELLTLKPKESVNESASRA